MKRYGIAADAYRPASGATEPVTRRHAYGGGLGI